MRLDTRLQSDIAHPNLDSKSLLLLPILVLFIDLLTPILIWKGIIPAYTRWISHAAIFFMIVIAYCRMMIFGRFPRLIWIIAGVSVFGITMALSEGQSIAATAWGWWMMFKYPLVGLFAYLQPSWPKNFPQRLLTFCTVILAIEVLVQIGFYFAGQTPGDDLSGTFGWKGVQSLLFLIMFVLCLAIGQWLSKGKWMALALVLVLGGLSSLLGEMKLFPLSALLFGITAMVIFTLKRGQFKKLVPYAVILGAVIWGFFSLYNKIVPLAKRTPIEQYLFDRQTLMSYLGGVEWTQAAGRYNWLGRNYALAHGWKTIQRDLPTLLFGWGLGARGESRTLGIAGEGLLQGYLGLSTGTTLLVVMQELGLVGVAVLGVVLFSIILALFRNIMKYSQSEAMGLWYGLLIFSLFWPLWLWYGEVQMLRVPMLLYWLALGYALSQSSRDQINAQQ